MTDLKTVQALVSALEYHRDQTRPITRTAEAIEAGKALIAQMQRDAVQPADVFWLYELTKGEGIYQGVRGPNAEQIMRQVVSGIDEAGEPFPVYAAPHPEAQQDDHAGSPAPSEPLFLLHCGKVDSSGEQDEWDVEADSYKAVEAFAALLPVKD